MEPWPLSPLGTGALVIGSVIVVVWLITPQEILDQDVWTFLRANAVPLAEVAVLAACVTLAILILGGAA